MERISNWMNKLMAMQDIFDAWLECQVRSSGGRRAGERGRVKRTRQNTFLHLSHIVVRLQAK